MSTTVATFKTDLQRKIRGKSLNKVQSVYTLMGEAMDAVLTELDPEETRRTKGITNAIHDQIYDYGLPSDVKELIDVRPQTARHQRSQLDDVSRRFARDFDMRKGLDAGTFEIRYNNGTKSIRFTQNISPAPKTLHTMDSITDNGTWAVGTDATNLTKDTVTKISGSASMNFDLDGSTTVGYIENSTFTDVDLTDHDELGSLFTWVFFPAASAITNVILRWGNDSSNYWHRTVTTDNEGNSFVDGWNLLRFDWNGATEVGTVAPASIDYLRASVTYDGTADTDIRVDNIISSIGEKYDAEYYSKFGFANSSSTWIGEPTADTDTIMFDVGTGVYNAFLYQCAYLLSGELQGESGVFDRNYFKEELYGDGSPRKPGLYKLYRRRHPSQTIKPQSIYYRTQSLR